MKKTLLALSVLALSLSAATAQTPTTTAPATGTDVRPTPQPRDGRFGMREAGRQAKPAKTPAQKADRRAAKLAKDLGLTADQEARVESIFLAQAQEMKTLKAKYAASADRKAGRAELQAVKAKYDGQLQSALGAALYASYDKLRDEQHDRAKQARGPKTKDGKAKLKVKS